MYNTIKHFLIINFLSICKLLSSEYYFYCSLTQNSFQRFTRFIKVHTIVYYKHTSHNWLSRTLHTLSKPIFVIF